VLPSRGSLKCSQRAVLGVGADVVCGALPAACSRTRRLLRCRRYVVGSGCQSPCERWVGGGVSPACSPPSGIGVRRLICRSLRGAFRSRGGWVAGDGVSRGITGPCEVVDRWRRDPVAAVVGMSICCRVGPRPSCHASGLGRCPLLSVVAGLARTGTSPS